MKTVTLEGIVGKEVADRVRAYPRDNFGFYVVKDYCDACPIGGLIFSVRGNGGYVDRWPEISHLVEMDFLGCEDDDEVRFVLKAVMDDFDQLRRLDAHDLVKATDWMSYPVEFPNEEGG